VHNSTILWISRGRHGGFAALGSRSAVGPAPRPRRPATAARAKPYRCRDGTR
jgi:hypothetical protein